jgi:hypothetical protein
LLCNQFLHYVKIAFTVKMSIACCSLHEFNFCCSDTASVSFTCSPSFTMSVNIDHATNLQLLCVYTYSYYILYFDLTNPRITLGTELDHIR